MAGHSGDSLRRHSIGFALCKNKWYSTNDLQICNEHISEQPPNVTNYDNDNEYVFIAM